MSIKEVCTKKVITIQADATLGKASNIMTEHHVGSLVVVESYDGRQIPSGIITDRDLALTLGSSANPQDLLVSQIMRSQPLTVSTNDGIFETIEKMERSGVKRLPVVDEAGSLYGIVCADDLLSLVSQESSKLAKITEVQARNEAGIRLPAEPQLRM